MSNSSIWPIDRTLLGATIPGQREPGSDGNERVLRILQSSSSIGASPSYCFISYPGHLLGGSRLYPTAVSVFCSPSCLGWFNFELFQTYIQSVTVLFSELFSFNFFSVFLSWKCHIDASRGEEATEIYKSVCQWSGRPGFNPRLYHTKVFKNGTWYFLA